ncbi:hypothetical protein HN588_02740 [Candidatus Bathyarchaeota archaeon]|nr:hypothetical protein [Candidatus Bathyarchaeota archaeon]
MRVHQVAVRRVIACVIISTGAASAQVIKEALHVDLSKALGFIVAQSFTLKRIQGDHPSLKTRTQVVASDFDLSFGTAEDNIRKALKREFGPAYPDFLSLMAEQGRKVVSSQEIDQRGAVAFLDEVELRAKGKIPSPVLETLLSYQFIDRPAEEMRKGYSRVFRKEGHPKAKGVDFQICHPISWRPDEGDRPNIVQKFKSMNGRGLESFLVMVRGIPLPKGYELTKEDLDELLGESGVRAMIPGGEIISSKSIVLDRQQGVMILFDQSAKRLDLTITTRNLLFLTIYANKMIFIQCSVAVMPGDEAELGGSFSRFEPLFMRVANSFVIQNQYKSIEEPSEPTKKVTDFLVWKFGRASQATPSERKETAIRYFDLQTIAGSIAKECHRRNLKAEISKEEAYPMAIKLATSNAGSARIEVLRVEETDNDDETSVTVQLKSTSLNSELSDEFKQQIRKLYEISPNYGDILSKKRRDIPRSALSSAEGLISYMENEAKKKSTIHEYEFVIDSESSLITDWRILFREGATKKRSLFLSIVDELKEF